MGVDGATDHTPSDHGDILQSLLKQDDDTPRMTRITSENPKVHPIGICLMVRHHHQSVGQVDTRHSTLIISFDEVGEVRGRVRRDHQRGWREKHRDSND